MLDWKRLLIVLAFLALLVVGALTAGRVFADGGDPAVGTEISVSAAGAGGLTIDGHGPLYYNELGPVDAMYAECTALPCVLQVDVFGKRTYIIVGRPVPRG